MKKSTTHYIAIVFGSLLLGTWLYLNKTIIAPQGIIRALQYVCIGLGCGILGHGIGEIVNRTAIKNHPDVEKQMKIDRQDERNVAIGNCAKVKAYDMIIFGALMLAFALMGVDMVALLLLVFPIYLLLDMVFIIVVNLIKKCS